MRACVQRVSSASVTVDGQVVGRIGRGLLVLLGVAADDTAADAVQLADKIVDLRIFNDADGKMNRSLLENVQEEPRQEAILWEANPFADESAGGGESLAASVGGRIRLPQKDAGQGGAGQGRAGMLVVSQFTLLGDCRKGRRPSFIAAAGPELAEQLYEVFAERARQRGVAVETGRFRAHMDVALVNDGPVTMLLDSRKAF